MKSFSVVANWSSSRRVWMAAAAVAAVLVVGVGGVALAHFRSTNTTVASVSKPSTCTDAYRLLGLRPSQITAAKPVCLVRSLKFSGELSGVVGEAYAVGADDPGPTSMCVEPKRWESFPPALLATVIGGKAYRLRISVPGLAEHQAVTLGNLGNVVELAAVKDPSADWNQASGTLTLNADGVSGTIDASLLRDVAGAHPVKVSGTWACGAALPPPSPDASIPCSGFYVLNQLAPADVARMKANACIAQDLTFSGDINAHVDHGVSDLGFPYGQGVNGDNFCSQAYGRYGATIKFSIGDETFQLNLTVFGDSSVGPGNYPAQGQGFSPVAVLYLGHADPANHGAFIQDEGYDWAATAGTVTLAPDLKSGTIDAALSGPAFKNFSTIHIAGSWRCAG